MILYWDDWYWSEVVLTSKQIELIDNAMKSPRIVNSYWPPIEAAIATGEADDDPFRRLAAQIRGPGERLARQVLQR